MHVSFNWLAKKQVFSTLLQNFSQLSARCFQQVAFLFPSVGLLGKVSCWYFCFIARHMLVEMNPKNKDDSRKDRPYKRG